MMGGAISILIGLTLWFTAFFLVPLGLVLIVVGIVSAVKDGKRADA